MKEQKQYLYQNIDLKNLPGERWRDIPDFDGLYQVSSYGRIKSLKRVVPGRWEKGRIVHERIRKSNLTINHNKTVNEELYSLSIALGKEGKKYFFSVARLVFYCFIRPFNLEDKNIFVSMKDKDGRNVHYKNLFPTTISALITESFASNRNKSHLTELSKPVTQFDSSGVPIAHYPSFYEAGKKTGFGGRAIAGAANGKYIVYKGYFWKPGYHNHNLNLSKVTAANGKKLPDINSNLMKRLGMKRLPKGEVPACLNLSLRNMKGERWKPFPDYEGLYEISNFGRVKSLKRITYVQRHAWVHEKIKHLTVDFRKDARGKEIAGNTMVSLDKGADKKMYSVARYVYHLFVAPFDIKDTNMRVYYKDGNTLNLHYKNLILRKSSWSFAKPGTSMVRNKD